MEHFRNEDNNIDFMVSSLGTTFDNANSISAPAPSTSLGSKTYAMLKSTTTESGRMSSVLFYWIFFFNLCAPFVVLFQVLLI